MKLKKTTLFIVIIVLGLNVFSQNTQDFNLKDDYKNSVLFAPFSIIGPYNPAIEIGYQKKINDKFSVLIQAGYIKKKFVRLYFETYARIRWKYIFWF